MSNVAFHLIRCLNRSKILVGTAANLIRSHRLMKLVRVWAISIQWLHWLPRWTVAANAVRVMKSRKSPSIITHRKTRYNKLWRNLAAWSASEAVHRNRRVERMAYNCLNCKRSKAIIHRWPAWLPAGKVSSSQSNSRPSESRLARYS